MHLSSIETIIIPAERNTFAWINRRETDDRQDNDIGSMQWDYYMYIIMHITFDILQPMINHLRFNRRLQKGVICPCMPLEIKRC